MRKTMFGAAVLAAMMTVPAVAATITKTFNFSTTNFTDVQGLTSVIPYSSVSGSFTVTFDPSLVYHSDTADLTINSFSGVPVSSPLGFTYYGNTGPYAGDFFLGGTLNDSDFVSIGTSDYVLSLNITNLSAPHAITCADPGIVCGNATGNAGVLASGYTIQGSNSLFFQLASATHVNAVPEPITWVMMVAGIGVIGASMRQRRSVNTRLQHA